MDDQGQIDTLMKALSAGADMAALMQADEAQAGHRVVHPGDEPWLLAADWRHDVTVAIDERSGTVRLVAILANSPGNGALRRTVLGIMSAGLTPCIVAPTREMRATVTRWGWQRRDVGVGWKHEEQWRPTALSAGPKPKPEDTR